LARALLQKLRVCLLVKKFSAFYGNRRFITAFIGARHLFTSWARSIQSMPSHITSLKYLSTLSSNLGLPSRLFTLGFPTKTLCAPLLSPKRAIFLAKLILLDTVTPLKLSEEYGSKQLRKTYSEFSRRVTMFVLKHKENTSVKHNSL